MIEVKHIYKDFVSPKKYPGLKGAIKGLFSTEKVVKRAVEDISFNIEKGEIVGYIGSNGAGKSTTIKMMTGILNPTKGECLVNGLNPSKNRRKNAKNIPASPNLMGISREKYSKSKLSGTKMLNKLSGDAR